MAGGKTGYRMLLLVGDATSEQTRIAVFHQVGSGRKVARWHGGWWQVDKVARTRW